MTVQERLEAIEAKLSLHEAYFNDIESILIKIQAIYEAMHQGDK
jgi:hypothetical protein